MATKLFVGGLAWKTDTEGLRSYFEQFGDVTDAEVIFDKHTQLSRGFGFVTLGTESEAKNVVEKTNNQSLDGRTIRVDFAGQRSNTRSGSYGGGEGGSYRGRSGGDRRRGGGGGGGYDQRPSRSGNSYRGSSYNSERSGGRSSYSSENGGGRDF